MADALGRQLFWKSWVLASDHPNLLGALELSIPSLKRIGFIKPCNHVVDEFIRVSRRCGRRRWYSDAAPQGEEQARYQQHRTVHDRPRLEFSEIG